MSDALQCMYINMCKMMLSAKMAELSKSHKNINQNEFKGNLWINMLAGLTHPQIVFKKHLKHGLTNKGVELMLPKLFQENYFLPSKSLLDPAVTDFFVVRIHRFSKNVTKSIKKCIKFRSGYLKFKYPDIGYEKPNGLSG